MRAGWAIVAILATVISATGQQREAVIRAAHVELRFPRRDNPDRTVREIERAYDHVREWGLDLPPRVLASSYPSTTDFVLHSGGSRYNLAAWSHGTLHLQPIRMLERRTDLRRGLRHELVHVALDRAQTNGLPRWIAEGVAMTIGGELQGVGRAPAGVDQLERDLKPGASYARARSAYGWARRLADDLITSRGRGGVVELLRRVAAGEPFETAFRTLTGDDSRSWVARRLLSR